MTQSSSSFRLLGATALLGAALLGSTPARAGGVAVNPNPCFFGGSTGGDPCQTGAAFSVGDKELTLLGLPNQGDGSIGFSQRLGVAYDLTVNFTPPISNPSGFFTFKLAITDPAKVLDVASLDYTGADVSPIASFYSDSSFSTLIGQILSTPGSFPPPFSFTSPTTELWGRVDYAGSPGSSIQDLSLTFIQTDALPPSVPGPLPLLGAGTAFGVSRRLRRRLKQRHRLG